MSMRVHYNTGIKHVFLPLTDTGHRWVAALACVNPACDGKGNKGAALTSGSNTTLLLYSVQRRDSSSHLFISQHSKI